LLPAAHIFRRYLRAPLRYAAIYGFDDMPLPDYLPLMPAMLLFSC